MADNQGKNRKLAFEEAYRLAVRDLRQYDGICPRDCDLCEDNETLVLLPAEAELIASSLPVLNKHDAGRALAAASGSTEDCPMRCTACSSCHIYENRPLDCRSFPVVPEFSEDGNDVNVRISRKYCPIADKLPPGFVDSVRRVWQSLAPYLPADWKHYYNNTPSL